MTDHSRDGTDIDRVLEDLAYEHARVSGDIIQIDAQSWAIHGLIAVDGDVLLAKFTSTHDAAAAIARLWAAEEGSTGT